MTIPAKHLVPMLALALLVPVFAGSAHGQVEGQGSESLPTREEAGPDYMVQGEYIGRLMAAGTDEMFGVQVVAAGDANFWAVGYGGGLPGAGWDRSEKLRFRGQTENAETILGPDSESTQYSLRIADRTMTVTDGAGRIVGRLLRVFRKSPTLLRKPPEGATVIFDGTSTEHVSYRNDQPVRMTEDGILLAPQGSGGLFTREPFQDCDLHLEFYLPFQPHARGQGRANSGCYVQGRYEVQILDSFGEEGTMGECGGMYMNADPMVNAAFPPLTWQTFDIEFTAARYGVQGGKRVTLSTARMTVYHNGILVHDDQITQDKKTTAAPTELGPEPERHYLQDHGHTIYFRNIWAVKKSF